MSGVPAALDEIWRLIQARDWSAAAERCRRLNAAFPAQPGGWYAASQIAMASGNPGAALAAIERALRLEPEQSRYLLQRSRCLLGLARHTEAAAAAAAALRRAGDDAALLDAIGTALSQANDHAGALGAYDRAIALAPHSAVFVFNRAAVRRYLGALSEAEQDYDRALALNPPDYDAYRNRSDLRVQTPSSNHVHEIEALLGRADLPWQGEVQLRYALAKEYEDLQEFGRAFAQLQRGASLRRRHLRYDVALDVATAGWIMAAFPAGAATEQRERAGPAADAAAPIFIVGLPRSGSTLVERILDSHSAVQSAGELHAFALSLMQALHAADPAGTRQQGPAARERLVARSATLDFAALGRDYLARAHASGASGARFIDKMPLNYLYCGLIRRALPQAPIVHVSRSPLAACYAMYKTLFRDGYPFSYDLDDLARYYIAYRRLMEHWHAAYPTGMHALRYERLVGEQLACTAELLQFCALPWEEACLQFHRNPTASTTASAVQIRRPLYSSSAHQWRHYREQLAGLAEQLRAAGIDPED